MPFDKYLEHTYHTLSVNAKLLRALLRLPNSNAVVVVVVMVVLHYCGEVRERERETKERRKRDERENNVMSTHVFQVYSYVVRTPRFPQDILAPLPLCGSGDV